MTDIRLDEVSGIRIVHRELVPAILDALRTADADPSTREPGAAISPALNHVNALMARAVVQCDLDPPPPPAIDIVVDTDGDLVHRCRHAAPHRWRLDGTRKP